MSPASVNPATSDATAIIHVSVPRMILRRSRMSPTAPAGRASTKKGSADAVWMSATYIGPVLSDTINQAAPTLCMKVPISETTFAVSRLRNVGERNGRQRLFDGRLDEFGNGSHLAFLNYQRDAGIPFSCPSTYEGWFAADRTWDQPARHGSRRSGCGRLARCRSPRAVDFSGRRG
jgi:hypothetical protein